MSLTSAVKSGLRRARYRYIKQHGGYLTTTTCGERVTFKINCPHDITRAERLNLETNVAEWLFAGNAASNVLWDVGAYHGHYSILASKKGMEVVAFEPNKVNRGQIFDHIAKNHVGVSIRPYPLSDRTTSVSLAGPDTSELEVTDGDEIEARKGDELTPQPDRLKIDVEGHELAVLDGLEATLPNIERVAIEVHGDTETAVRNRLESAGLDVVEIETPRSQTYLGGYNG